MNQQPLEAVTRAPRRTSTRSNAGKRAGNLAPLSAAASPDRTVMVSPENEISHSKKASFVHCLCLMLTNESKTNPHLMGFVADGSEIYFRDTKSDAFGDAVARYFSHRNWGSLRRQLSAYQFKRTHRGGRQMTKELLIQMQKQRINKPGPKLSSSSKTTHEDCKRVLPLDTSSRKVAKPGARVLNQKGSEPSLGAPASFPTLNESEAVTPLTEAAHWVLDMGKVEGSLLPYAKKQAGEDALPKDDKNLMDNFCTSTSNQFFASLPRDNTIVSAPMSHQENGGPQELPLIALGHQPSQFGVVAQSNTQQQVASNSNGENLFFAEESQAVAHACTERTTTMVSPTPLKVMLNEHTISTPVSSNRGKSFNVATLSNDCISLPDDNFHRVVGGIDFPSTISISTLSPITTNNPASPFPASPFLALSPLARKSAFRPVLRLRGPTEKQLLGTAKRPADM